MLNSMLILIMIAGIGSTVLILIIAYWANRNKSKSPENRLLDLSGRAWLSKKETKEYYKLQEKLDGKPKRN